MLKNFQFNKILYIINSIFFILFISACDDRTQIKQPALSKTAIKITQKKDQNFNLDIPPGKKESYFSKKNHDFYSEDHSTSLEDLEENENSELDQQEDLHEDLLNDGLSNLFKEKNNDIAVQFDLRSKLTEELYQTILQMNDLSNTLATLHIDIDVKTRDILENRIDQISYSLSENGWFDYSVLIGATGAKNQDQDASCVITHNRSSHEVIVAFHGSRNGSKNPIWNSGKGDWGSNWSLSSASAGAPITEGGIGIQYIPSTVSVHTGFGKNFQSVQESLNTKIIQILKSLSPEERKLTSLIFTGNSRGGAVALIGALATKSYLSTLTEELGDIHISVITFSAPHAFNGDASLDWVYSQINKKDIFRINVYGDPIPSTPLKKFGFKHAGILFLDKIEHVSDRLHSSFGINLKSWFNTKSWLIAHHYVSNARNAGGEFTPNIVLQYKDLVENFDPAQQND